MQHSTTIDEDQEDYRFKGNSIGIGKIIKGTMNEAPIKLKVSSIPSKYENIVYRSNSSHAFGDSTNKFYHPSQTRDSFNPGPGMYESGANFQKISSKKGTGSFASTSKLSRMERSRSHVPGPGSYQVICKIGSAPITRLKKSKSSLSSFLNTTAQSTVALSTKLQTKAHDLFKYEITESKKFPGPGFYDLAGKTEGYGKKLSLKSNFKSKVDRFIDNKMETPAVGQYNLITNPNEYKPRTKRLQNEGKKQVMQTDNERKMKLEKIIQSSDKLINKSALGPGAYDPQVCFSGGKGFKIKENMYDRFGNLKQIYAMAKAIDQEKSQVPQDLNPAYTPSIQTSKAGITSIFKSTTKRSQFWLKDKMDPCQYDGSKSPVKKSHHINFTQKWV